MLAIGTCASRTGRQTRSIRYLEWEPRPDSRRGICDAVGSHPPKATDREQSERTALGVLSAWRGVSKRAISIQDPGTFTKPWQLHMVWTLAPGEEIGEFICENNKYFGDTRAK